MYLNKVFFLFSGLKKKCYYSLGKIENGLRPGASYITSWKLQRQGVTGIVLRLKISGTELK